MNFDISTMLKS